MEKCVGCGELTKNEHSRLCDGCWVLIERESKVLEGLTTNVEAIRKEEAIFAGDE